MARHLTQKKRLSLIPALILCGAAIALYQIFKSPELDRQIDKVIGHEPG